MDNRQDYESGEYSSADLEVNTREEETISDSIKKNAKKQQNKERNKFWLGVVVGALIATVGMTVAIFLKGLSVVRQLEKSGEKTKTENVTKFDSIVNKETTVKMATIEKMINTYYYEDVDQKELRDGVFRGMLASLGDPYSEYYSEEELGELRNETQGIYYGIGAYITQDAKTGVPIISGTIPGTPAEEANLQADDIIYKIDGIDSTEMSTTDVVKLIKGEEHTYVTLTLIRDGEEVVVDVERRKIESPTVNYEMYENNVGYIQITEFDDVTTDQFTEAMAVLKGQGMEALILDLRTNGGGNLTTCCEIAQQLLPEGLIVYTEDKHGEREEYTCDGTRKFDKPLVVLVNGYSASASEILTGAIKDHGIGVIMGTTTYGKGIVQQIMPLNDGTALKVTISKYYTPSGNYIHGVGIAPDIEVEFDGDNYKKGEYDNQIEAAKEQIEKMRK